MRLVRPAFRRLSERHIDSMLLKSFVTSAVVLLSMTVTLTATIPDWNIDNLGIPNPLPNSGDDGFQLSLYPPGGAVATNGTVYALGYDEDYLYLANWTLCSGWAAIATFGLPTSYEFAGPLTLCLSGNGSLYVGGEFISVTEWPDGPTVNATNIAVYNLNSGSWSGLGNAFLGFDTNPVTAVAVDSNEKVYIATYPIFSTVHPFNPVSATNIFMVYSNTQWVSVGGGSMKVYQGYTDGFPVDAMVANGTDIYLAGDLLGGNDGPQYTNIFVASTNIIKWNGSSNAWQAMGAGSDIWGANVDSGGYDAQIYSLAVLGTNVFIAGGWASGMGETSQPGPGYGVGRFSTNGLWIGLSACPPLLNSACGYQNGLTLAVQNGNVYLGGDFEYTSNCTVTAANGIGVWNGSGFQPLTSGGVQIYNGSYSPGTVNWLAGDANALYVFGTFNVAGGLATTNAARYVTTSVGSSILDPCQKTWPLINVNFGQYQDESPKGPAAFGFSTNDDWNLYGATVKCIDTPLWTNLIDLTNVFGFTTHVGISIGPAGANHQLVTGSTDFSVLSNCFNTLCAGNFTLTVTNLPLVQASGLSGAYDIYVYGYGGTTTISGTEYTLNGQFTISPSGTNVYGDPVTTLTTSSAIYDINTWYESSQYVVFPNVPISSGTKLKITVAPDPSSPAGSGYINGIQIVPYPYYPQ